MNRSPASLALLASLSLACSGGDPAAATTTPSAEQDATAIVAVLATASALGASAQAPLEATVRMPLTPDGTAAFESKGDKLPWRGSYDRYADPLIESPPEWGSYVGIGVTEEGGRASLHLELALTNAAAVRSLAAYATEVGFRGATIELRTTEEPIGLGGEVAGPLRPAGEHFGVD